MKRAIDVAAAGTGLVVLSPLLATVAALEIVVHGRPALFHQTRPGLSGVPFRMVKFRTMTDARGPDGSLLPDAERLTRFGRWLRSTSVDELPELWNVLRGDMSLVGPRPLLTRYLDRYTPAQMRRHEMPPGMTGWAQVQGRNSISWEQKFALDLWYIDNWSLRLDFEILLTTLAKVARREGITAPTEATMPEFMGSSETGGRG